MMEDFKKKENELRKEESKKETHSNTEKKQTKIGKTK
jgi:hypothetical protein